MSICRLEPEHVDGAAALEAECFSVPWSRDAIKHMAENGAPAYVLLEDGRTAAWAAALIAADEGEIGRIAVDPAYRNRGLGSVLLSHVLGEGRRAGVKNWFLEVRRGNIPALRLYENAGFAPVGVRPAYYTDPVEDAVIMRRQEESDA